MRYQKACAVPGLDQAARAAFEKACRDSAVVINRGVDDVLKLVTNDRFLYKSWYQQLADGEITPENSPWDEKRIQADAALFTHYKEELRFGCLSIDACGLWNYGTCTMVLNERMITYRTTFFHENTAIWYRANRNKKKTPAGFRAVWEDRHLLCVAKHAADLVADPDPAHFPQILLRPGATTKDDVFIEAHVYGPFNRQAIKQLKIRDQNLTDGDRQRLKEKLASCLVSAEYV